MPIFTVVAGPNGAGKSTFSAMFSRPGALIFDPDVQKYKIEKQYPDISDDAIGSVLTKEYINFQGKALGKMLHLTVETNLQSDYLLSSVEIFKQASYDTRLIYMLLPDIATSIDRVALRVKQKGHFVDIESVKTNFEVGPKNLLKIADQFDRVMLISGFNNNPQVETQPQLLINIENGMTRYKSDEIPDWCKGIVNSTEVAATYNQASKGHKI
ncbi:zeta toxin family protein [Mucilaginibacter glaciei]|uniref:Zeta toxin family protein n=1 Tax=Mucilaginibacter glaciei TaxID=2772109 RepID=A0A926S3V3_9SPHI|nr:zeta toxin family protein [Mucilaginibacter glaciei]MBD1395307.1 zeta toxin family protein [Mucilaginibacter glaciei]